jgi:hypothetical protein
MSKHNIYIAFKDHFIFMRKSFTFNLLTKSLIVSTLLIAFLNNANAQVSGTVFRDFNANGIRTTTAPDPIEPGLKDVTVNAYDAGGSYTATTDATGAYAITGGTGPYRVEFILPPYYYASKGSSSNTTVQFIAANGVGSLGVNYPGDYCQANPPISTSVMISNPMVGGYSNPKLSYIEFPYGTTGNTLANTFELNNNVINSTWGVSYNRLKKKIYVSSVFKRFVGLNEPTSKIYEIESSTSLIS